MKNHFFLFSLNTLAKLFTLLQAYIPTLISGKALPLLSAGQAGGREISFPSLHPPQAAYLQTSLLWLQKRFYDNFGFNTLSCHKLTTNKTHEQLPAFQTW